MTDRPLALDPGWQLFHLRDEIPIVVTPEIGIEPAKPETLKEMGLSLVADVVIDATVFGPSRHRHEMADEDRKAQNQTEQLAGQ
jgi:hypothetical protein